MGFVRGAVLNGTYPPNHASLPLSGVADPEDHHTRLILFHIQLEDAPSSVAPLSVSHHISMEKGLTFSPLAAPAGERRDGETYRWRFPELNWVKLCITRQVGASGHSKSDF